MSNYDDQLELEVERFRITENFDKLYGMLKSHVKGKSIKYANKYRKKKLRIYEHDFESILWEAAVDLIHDEGYRKHRFRIVLNHRLEDRAKNVVRDFMMDKRRALTTATTINETVFPGQAETEQTATIRVLFEQLSNGHKVTEQERRLLMLLKVYPDASNQELADLLGFGYRERVRRMKLSLRGKGLRYFADD